jgi:hypothetical protein
VSSFLGTLVIAANTRDSFDAPNDGVKAILIGNESGFTVTVTMESGGVQKTLYPSTVDWFEVRKGFSGKILVNPLVVLNNTATFPASSLIFDAIGLNDPEQATMYPIALPRNTNIGNTVSTTSVNTLTNEGNSVGTEIIDTGTPSNSRLMDFFNDHFVWSVEQSTVKHQVLKGQTSGSPLLAGQAGDTSEVAGALKVNQATTLVGSLSADNGAIITDGAGKITTISQILGWILGTKTLGQASAGDILDANTTNQTYLKGGAAGAIFMQPASGTTSWSFDNNGDLTIHANAGLNFNVGRIKDINNGSALSGTINHGLSGTPGAVVNTCNTASSSATVGAYSYTSTQFGMTIGGSLNGRWVAYR